MASLPLSPIAALRRWLAQLHYNSIRNVETMHDAITRNDQHRPLRGVFVADDLCLTRKRTFYQIVGTIAKPISLEEVAAHYPLVPMQEQYRVATERWKNAHRDRTVS